MIVDSESLDPLLAGGAGTPVLVKAGGVRRVLGVRIHHGHIAIRQAGIFPLLNGQTCGGFFQLGRPEKYDAGLAAPLAESDTISSCVFIPGDTNYFHFVMWRLPAMLLVGFEPGDAVTIGTTDAFPSNADNLLRNIVVPALARGRPVNIDHFGLGDYVARDVVYPLNLSAAFAAFMSKKVRAMVWAARAITDAMAQLGAVKLFVMRKRATTGRNLRNEDEVREWFEARGYVAIDPGQMSMEEQIIIFSRATHVAGVEGAALVNLLFTVNAPNVIMLASPAVREEQFFRQIAEQMRLRLDTIVGDLLDSSGGRDADFIVPVARLQKYQVKHMDR